MFKLALPNKASLLADMTTAMTPAFMAQISAACFIIKDGELRSQQFDLAGAPDTPLPIPRVGPEDDREAVSPPNAVCGHPLHKVSVID